MGNTAVRGAVGLATDVTCVIVGTPVITLTGGAVVFDAWLAALAMFAIWMAYATTGHLTSIGAGGTCQMWGDCMQRGFVWWAWDLEFATTI